ncbi:hypothetical protein IscW_ISCW007261, partial [Ixodes scapularis]
SSVHMSTVKAQRPSSIACRTAGFIASRSSSATSATLRDSVVGCGRTSFAAMIPCRAPIEISSSANFKNPSSHTTSNGLISLAHQRTQA